MLAALLYSGEVNPSLYGHCGTDIGNSGFCAGCSVTGHGRGTSTSLTNFAVAVAVAVAVAYLGWPMALPLIYSPRSTF